MKLLHIDSSALGAHSVSRDLSAAIVAAWKRREPGLRVEYRDLAAQPLPHWVPVADAAARDGGAVLDEFLAADVVVIGAPMYNFGIPSTLKAWIDRIVIAGKTFRHGATGVEGLAGGRKVIIASARGGFYGAESGRADFDFQEAYLRKIFGFIGITDIEFVRAEGVGISPEHRTKAVNEAHAAIDARLPAAA
ncbi:MAG TPA: NAD(P)H-dependent oxidoreductase [Rhodanobacteraceae bacterium]|jgi:FMN-dependent NADH-azoreductase|nr:NAD(P)H-dependent oxidoreductase [Rhodanobacteraceae bacterium]